MFFSCFMSTENNYFIMQLLQIHIKIQKWASFYFSFYRRNQPRCHLSTETFQVPSEQSRRMKLRLLWQVQLILRFQYLLNRNVCSSYNFKVSNSCKWNRKCPALLKKSNCFLLWLKETRFKDNTHRYIRPRMSTSSLNDTIFAKELSSVAVP